MEFLADVPIMEEIVGEKFPIGRLSDLSVCDSEACERACDLIVRFHRQLGFDYVCVLVEAPLASTYTAADDPALARPEARRHHVLGRLRSLRLASAGRRQLPTSGIHRFPPN